MLETGMDNLFKQNLLRLRRPVRPVTFGEALLGAVHWGKTAPIKEKNIQEETYSEKAQVLESLERFVQDKIEEDNTPVIKFERGEIHLKAGPQWISETYSDLPSLLNRLSFPNEIKEIIFRNKERSAVTTIFVTENFREYSESRPELSGSFLDELTLQFPLKTAEYFGRMIAAMKLNPEEVLIYPAASGDEDLSDEVIALIHFYSPAVVVTLGAIATQKVLKSNDRLSTIHGQFFTRKINDSKDFTVVPLFHPTIIEANQNHKKAAWSDMQKIMKHLKKLP